MRGHRISRMKQANNNEVDLLLRSLARGREKTAPRSGSASRDGSLVFSDHLDADELNSYAEGVAPATARARYLEHLADCEACRSIVIGLTQAAGVAGRYEVSQPAVGSNLWRKLSALFSPTVLRYAVPALVLTAVIGISLLVLQQRPVFVARNDTAQSPPAASEPLVSSGAIEPSTEATPSAVPRGNPPGAATESNKEQSNLQDRKTEAERRPLLEDAPTLAKAAPAKDSSQPGEGAGVAASRPYALEPKAASPPPSSADRVEADKSGEFAKESSAKREEQSRSRDDFRNQPADEHGPNRSRSNNNAMPMSQRNAGATAGSRGPSGLDKNKVEAVETRSVSGRRFTREGNAWVDTDYDSSRSTIKVTRGSDQFRALVADEPGIRAIADQLSGTVIVVWKNRAYRIQ